ncbi:hypothetical protein AF332_19115 [Sporosarcina globispora]|uniref:Uncharacterized protein n=2 Tax=Sporosarcina globispora TaxID=1459 RepID=A0A0M0GGY1_SPOGL|nr:hypothetical protein AF332_19115 [Sporosarcina globispora]
MRNCSAEDVMKEEEVTEKDPVLQYLGDINPILEKISKNKGDLERVIELSNDPTILHRLNTLKLFN